MSQDPNNNNPNRFGGNRPPGPGDDPNGQPPRKGPRFSIYWIYAIIFAVLIGFQVFGLGSPNMKEINQERFEELRFKHDGLGLKIFKIVLFSYEELFYLK